MGFTRLNWVIKLHLRRLRQTSVDAPLFCLSYVRLSRKVFGDLRFLQNFLIFFGNAFITRWPPKKFFLLEGAVRLICNIEVESVEHILFSSDWVLKVWELYNLSAFMSADCSSVGK